ncbi:type II toxin-antitoxin system PemK/MazF family toxin [Carnobacterium divergens]|uniref:type II toxin-antitoxin system PemK/MazF family toxin n=1 Tax=Carnobacterium divergens TaxID=2748 RepID=UPI00142FB0EF|nr:type II toxin-antitoxin system PemK/MazF family toxin [Carnobacterium divergens]
MSDNVKKKICDEANIRFINESLSGYDKFKYLPNWLKNKSKYLEAERTRPPKNQKVYKRSSIIYVDFGINVGNELSGNHFAIVLNNKDNNKNGVLSVVPISSKNKKNYISVGEIIKDSSIKHFSDEARKTQAETKCLLVAMKSKGLITETVLKHEGIKKILNDGNEISLDEALKKMESSGIDLENIDSIITKVKFLTQDAEAQKKVYHSYQKYSKKSFAMPLSIQTVSKDRIRKINKFDPSGNIKAPKDVMIRIDEAIMKNYTKSNL